MDILNFTRQRSAELAEYLEEVCQTPLLFEGDDPLRHSSDNHVHLWKLEYLADDCAWIDTEYRVEFVCCILDCWRKRLKGLKPYAQAGYRLYVYEDTAPTLSVVAETPRGFPYAHLKESAQFVSSIRDVVAIYCSRSWQEHFAGEDWSFSPKKILGIVQHSRGSISKPTADKLGIKVGTLRKLIINMGIGDQVNSIRKHYKRTPADFSNEPEYDTVWRIFERCLPARF